VLPNFLCIGAQKSGTTALSLLLESHPDLFMARPRETRFFVDEMQHPLGIAHYELAHFAAWNGQRAVGEKTPLYLLWPDTPARVRAMLGPDIRLIVTLRSPAERAFSHYRHTHQMQAESLSFGDALAAEPERIAQGRLHQALFGYRLRGCYARLLKPWLAAFPRENFLFLCFETDLLGNAQSLADRLFAFLGIAPIRVDAMPRAGRPTLPEWEVAPDALTLRTPQAETIIRAPSPALRAFAAAARQARPATTDLPDARALNSRLWRDEIAETAALTGLDLDHWLAGDTCGVASRQE
jgi:hypothetical protein